MGVGGRLRRRRHRDSLWQATALLASAICRHGCPFRCCRTRVFCGALVPPRALSCEGDVAGDFPGRGPLTQTKRVALGAE